jgi:hypothetical protein
MAMPCGHALRRSEVASIAHSTTVVSREASPATRRTAVVVGVCGLLANVAYALTASELLGDVATPIVASLFGPLIAAASVALYGLLAAERPTFAGQLAAVANVAAGALVTAMMLVQVAVNDVETGLTPAVNDAFEHVEFGLDLAWDVFLVAGTILFCCAMFGDPRFGRRFALPGIGFAVGLYVLNFATFPTPPASEGLVDLGPFVGLWYAAVSVQALRLRRLIRPETRTRAVAKQTGRQQGKESSGEFWSRTDDTLTAAGAREGKP